MIANLSTIILIKALGNTPHPHICNFMDKILEEFEAVYHLNM